MCLRRSEEGVGSSGPRVIGSELPDVDSANKFWSSENVVGTHNCRAISPAPILNIKRNSSQIHCKGRQGFPHIV